MSVVFGAEKESSEPPVIQISEAFLVDFLVISHSMEPCNESGTASIGREKVRALLGRAGSELARYNCGDCGELKTQFRILE